VANKLVQYNPGQIISVLHNPTSEVEIAGRGKGKSAIIGHKMHRINSLMPRSVTSITGKTFGQLLTRTLPSTLKFIEEYFGYVKDVHYVINRKPPSNFKEPYERILKHENFISFINGTGYLLLS
jgi:tRNA(Met) C34 N-acetyltransferase TmcA